MYFKSPKNRITIILVIIKPLSVGKITQYFYLIFYAINLHLFLPEIEKGL